MRHRDALLWKISKKPISRNRHMNWGKLLGKGGGSGFLSLKEYSMTHMLAEKITASAGIGKSTFYNFFRQRKHLYMN